MYIYLADIIIYTDTVDEHWVKHIWKVFEILCYEKLFLSLAKMQFFCQWWPTYPGSYHQGTGYNHGSTQGHYNSELEGSNKQNPSGKLHWCCRILSKWLQGHSDPYGSTHIWDLQHPKALNPRPADCLTHMTPTNCLIIWFTTPKSSKAKTNWLCDSYDKLYKNITNCLMLWQELLHTLTDTEAVWY